MSTGSHRGGGAYAEGRFYLSDCTFYQSNCFNFENYRVDFPHFWEGGIMRDFFSAERLASKFGGRPDGGRVNQDIERLRAVAVLLVLVSHGQVLFSWLKFQQLITGYHFQIGVDLFFVISGYVIAMSIFRELDNRDANEPTRFFLYRFWVRRAFRLLPAAIVCIAVSTALSHLVYGENLFVMLKAAFAALFNVFNFYLLHALVNGVSVGMLEPYWSLSLEEQFYVIFPLLVLVVSTKRRLAMIAIAGVIGIELAFSVIPNLFWFIRFDGLCCGVLLACASPYIKKIRLPKVFGKVVGLALLAFFIPVALGYLFPVAGFFGAQTIPLACCVILVIFAVMDSDVFNFPLIGRALAYLGSRSYTVYLLHLTFFFAMGRVLLATGQENNTLAVLLAGLSLITFMVLVELMFRFVETPFRDYGKRVASRIKLSNSSVSSEPVKVTSS
ncbi:acyltransferase family protein [Pseudomonas sp. RIT288]|uniref:acyltransferase family protein n=1 Tax=Pseudomonas sp. RIT288 TaxID=1470589 RepID=UPI001268CE2B|nr:acyltransferase [Pseudomonas sp. RIT288]